MNLAMAGTTDSSPRVLFVLNPGLARATAQARGTSFAPLFQEHGWRVEYTEAMYRPWIFSQSGRKRREDEIVRMAADFDLVYLLKVNSLRLVEELKNRTSAKVIFDLVDPLWEAHHQRTGWYDLEAILTRSDAIFSENEWICAYARKYNSRVYGIPSCSQVERFDAVRTQTSRRSADRIVIGWIGSRSTVCALEKILRPLEIVGARYPNLTLRIVGCGDHSGLPRLKHIQSTSRPTYNEDEMIQEILDFDIGVFPPPFDIEEYCVRGVLKGLLYMAGGVPPLFQDAGECKDFIRDGENGMLAGNEQEWTERLELLIASADLRREMGRLALQTVRNLRSLRHVFSVLQSSLLDVHRLPRQERSLGKNGLWSKSLRTIRRVGWKMASVATMGR